MGEDGCHLGILAVGEKLNDFALYRLFADYGRRFYRHRKIPTQLECIYLDEDAARHGPLLPKSLSMVRVRAERLGSAQTPSMGAQAKPRKGRKR
jgi:hypothetical protein